MAATNDINEEAEVSAFPPDMILMLIPKEQFLRSSFKHVFDAKYLAEGRMHYRENDETGYVHNETVFVGEVLKNKYGPNKDAIEIVVNPGL